MDKFVIFSIFFLVGILCYYIIAQENKYEARCIAKGGEWHTGRDIRLCLKPDAVIKIK